MTADGPIDLCPRCDLRLSFLRQLKPIWPRPPLPITSSSSACAPKVPLARFCAIRCFSSGPIAATGLVCRVRNSYQFFEAINLNETKLVRLGEWWIQPTDFNESDGSLSFSLASDLPITRLTIRDETGEEVGGIAYTMNGGPVVEMPEELFDATVKIEVQFLEPLRRSVEFSERVRVGL